MASDYTHNKLSKGRFHIFINRGKLHKYISCPRWFMGLFLDLFKVKFQFATKLSHHILERSHY